jgi:ElaB/YqjD/DUF883 family membrane-anchored ribosome-binding protein
MADTSSKGSNVRDKAQDTAAAARQTAHEAKATVQEGTAALGQKAQDAASNLAHRAQETAANVGSKAQEFLSAAGDKTDTALSSVGQGLSSLAGTIREKAPHEGYVGSAATAMAEGLQTGGRYLQQHGVNDMLDDLNSLIRSHPLAALGVAFGCGWLFGLASRR